MTGILYDFFVDNKYPNELSRRFISWAVTRNLEFFRLNKLAVAIGIIIQRCNLKNSDLLLQRVRRYATYINEAKCIYDNLADSNIDSVIIKTIYNFPKDIADIDILIASNRDLEKTSIVLRRIGYYPAKPGLEQHLWRRVVGDVVVDVEIHTKIAAAGYEYYPKKLIFDRAIYKNNIKVPSHIDSVLLMAAHLIMKDLYITLSDILELEVTLRKYINGEEILLEEAKKLNLEIPLLTMMYYSSIINSRISRKLGVTQKLFTTTRFYEYHARPSLVAIAFSYFQSVLGKIRREPLSKVLPEILSLPRGKGIDAFVYYIFGFKPAVKRFEE